MNVDDLNKLPLEELRNIRNKNLVLFNVLAFGDLAVFYHSMYTEKWLLLFATLGIFIVTLSLYDNYRYSRDLVMRLESQTLHK